MIIMVNNIILCRKWEIAEGYFHRPEILLHGTVVGVPDPDDVEKVWSYMLSSDHRTKDAKLVEICLEIVLENALEKARENGNQPDLLVHKTDRPTSEYWNAPMIEAHR